MNIYAFEFLKRLDPTTDSFCFQPFPEALGADFSAPWRHGSLEQLDRELTNWNQSGFGIAVCINETDGLGRSKENIKRIRALWLDDDGVAKTDFPLEPSMVVQTSHVRLSKRYHYYWLVEDGWLADEQGQNDFRVVMQALADRFGGDKSAIDISRVLRLPGFNHVKSEPQLVKLIHDGGTRYSRQQLLHAFGALLADVASPPLVRELNEDWANDEVDLEEIAEALNFIPPWRARYVAGCRNGASPHDWWKRRRIRDLDEVV